MTELSDSSIFIEIVFYCASCTLYGVNFLINRVIKGEHYYNPAYKYSNWIVEVLLAIRYCDSLRGKKSDVV